MYFFVITVYDYRDSEAIGGRESRVELGSGAGITFHFPISHKPLFNNLITRQHPSVIQLIS